MTATVRATAKPVLGFWSRTEILRSEVGSTLHGTGLEGGEDRDEMGVCVEPPNYVLGVERFEQYEYRTQAEGVRSGPGDTDLVIYSLRKYVRLAMQGNPSILLPLYAPEDRLVICTELGVELRALAPAIVSTCAGDRFLGYLRNQKERLLDVRGGRHTNRPELVGQYGYDVKYAMHALRLGYQGVELISTGRITLPIPDDPGDYLCAVRRGDVPFDEMIDRLGLVEEALISASQRTWTSHVHRPALPAAPNIEAINRFMRRAHDEIWALYP